MTRTNIHFLVIYTLLGACFVWTLLKEQQQSAVVYVNTNKVYDDFLLKQQLEKKLEATQYARKAVLDSLMLNLKVLNDRLQLTPTDKTLGLRLDEMKQGYLEKESGFAQDNKRQMDEYNTRIWNQLNQYIKDYGVKKSLNIILGANGSGKLMYADEALDITPEVVLYVNERYKGAAK